MKSSSVDVAYAASMKPGDLYAGDVNPAAPTRPVQVFAAAHRLTEVAPYAAGGGRQMLRLRAGALALTPVPAASQVLIIREGEPAAAGDDRLTQAVEDGTDFVADQLDLGERDTDLLSIIANAIGTAWDRPGQPLTWPQFIAENWSAEPGTSEDPATWWDFKSTPEPAAAEDQA
jgi:hypothetical protein